MKKVLVTGASGMLGSAIVDTLIKNEFEVFGVSRTPNNNLSADHQFLGDLSSYDFVRNLALYLKPEIIIHTAAYVNLNLCEENKEKAYNLHVKATGDLTSLFPDSRFIYISTDSVFDGEHGNYIESDMPYPLNYYAETKYLGEKEVLQKSNNPIVLRVNIYGSRESGGVSLGEWALKELKAGNEISGFNDVHFNPLYIYQVSDVVLEMISLDKSQTGIFHIGCKEYVSKYSFLLKLAETFNLNSNLILESDMRSIVSIIKRPFNTTLNSSHLNNVIGKTYSLDEGLSEFYLLK